MLRLRMCPRLRSRSVHRAALVALGLVLSTVTAIGSATATPTADAPPPASSCSRTWVGAWAGPNKQGDAGSLDNQTFRMIVHTYLPGERLRVRLTNALGSEQVKIDRVTLGISDGAADVVPGSIAQLTFAGRRNITLPAGARIWSDPISYSLPSDTDLAIGIFAKAAGPLTGHTTSPALADRPPSLRATGEVRTSYLTPPGSGDHTEDPSGDAFTQQIATEMVVDAVDVLPNTPTGAVVVLGDSISDGTNSTQDADRSWPDFLARRLLAEHPADRMAVLNMGIAGNAVTGDGSGPSAVHRLDRDVLQQSGARAVILLQGINDLGFATDPGVVQRLRAAVTEIVDRVHAAGLPIFAGLLTPTGDLTNPGLYSSPLVSLWRHQHNDWLRTPGLFDGVIDFDAVVRNPDAPEQWATGLSRDQLHGNDESYRLMAEAVDLSLPATVGC